MFDRIIATVTSVIGESTVQCTLLDEHPDNKVKYPYVIIAEINSNLAIETENSVIRVDEIHETKLIGKHIALEIIEVNDKGLLHCAAVLLKEREKYSAEL